MALVYLVILWKYQTLLPFGILLFTLEYVFRLLVSKGFLAGKTMATDGQAPGGIGNIIFPLFLFSSKARGPQHFVQTRTKIRQSL